MDEFDTVAITYSQPEAAVMLSFLRWHGVQAYALSEHARVSANLVTALGGIPVRVASADAEHARALLAEVAPAEPPVIRPPIGGNVVTDRILSVLWFLFGATPPPRVKTDRF